MDVHVDMCTHSWTFAKETKKRGTYHLFQTEYLFALVGQVDLGDGDLPSAVILGDAGVEGAADDLVAEADADDADAAGVEGLAGVVGEGDDPLVVEVGRVLGAGDEDGVDVVEGGVGGGVVDDVVAGDGEVGGDGVRVGGGGEEGREEAGVVAVAGDGLGLRGVGFEDGEADGGHVGDVLCRGGPSSLVWPAVCLLWSLGCAGTGWASEK